MRNQDVSVAKARQAVSSYRKAFGDPAGLPELMVFYCESAAGFCNEVGNQDVGYLPSGLPGYLSTDAANQARILSLSSKLDALSRIG